jgi:hypothetical protein
VHSFVTTQIRELGVGLEAHLTLERLHARVYMRVLLKPRRRGERLSAFWTRMGSRAHVMGPYVPLEITGVGEDLWAVLAMVLPVLAVDHRPVLYEARAMRVGLGAKVAPVLIPAVVVLDDEMVV